MHQGLTSSWLEFNTQLVETKLPRLYAPSTWDDGSSIYHLDEFTYAASDTNSLMTPFAGRGEAVHNPGPNTLAISSGEVVFYPNPASDLLNVQLQTKSAIDLANYSLGLYLFTLDYEGGKVITRKILIR